MIPLMTILARDLGESRETYCRTNPELAELLQQQTKNPDHLRHSSQMGRVSVAKSGSGSLRQDLDRNRIGGDAAIDVGGQKEAPLSGRCLLISG